MFDRVVAVEPAEAMRRLLLTPCPEAEVRPGMGQQIPLSDTSVDAIFAAEVFHWFDDDRALAEIALAAGAGGAVIRCRGSSASTRKATVKT